jgi:hypothetical protein
LNSIRLRVWVSPPGGYSGAADMLAKAKRAQALGQRLLLGFQQLRTLASGPLAPAGSHTLPLGALDGLPQGVYLVQLSADGYTSTQCLVKP